MINLVKLYFEFKHIPSPDVISQFLVRDVEFNSHIKNWDPTIESSLCLGVKKTLPHNRIIDYFHIKHKPGSVSYKPVHNKLLFTSKKTGVSCEYVDGSITEKKYFYFDTPVEKLYISNKFNLDPCVSHYEYTEFKDTFKIINVYEGQDDKVSGILRNMNIHILNSIMDDFEHAYSKKPCFYGGYENGAISVYWSFTATPSLLDYIL